MWSQAINNNLEATMVDCTLSPYIIEKKSESVHQYISEKAQKQTCIVKTYIHLHKKLAKSKSVKHQQHHSLKVQCFGSSARQSVRLSPGHQM